MKKKIANIIFRYWIYILPLIPLTLLVISFWDKNYYFGGDAIFPIIPQDSIIKSIFVWEEQNGGSSFYKYMLLFWQGFFWVFSVLGIPSFISIKVFIILLFVIGYIFTYLLYLTLFKGSKYYSKPLATVAATIFTFNPISFLVVTGAVPVYVFPACFFFIVKFLDTKNILYAILFSFFFNIAFFPDLPQAKLLIIFILSSVFLLMLYITLRKTKLLSILSSLLLLWIITFLLNAFLLLPFLNDSFGARGVYQQFTSEIGVYHGDADLFSASIPYISRFYNSNILDMETRLGQALSALTFVLWTFGGLLIAILSVFFVKDKNEKKIIYICMLAYVFFLFIAKGPNPPFAELYKWFIYHIPIAKLFRTTASTVMGGVVFYSILLTISLYYLSKKWTKVLFIFVVIHIIVFFPLYSGYKLDNLIGDTIHEEGVSIPQEYFSLGNFLDTVNDPGKVLVLPLSDGYVAESWEYFGQSLIPWITKRPLIPNTVAIGENVDLLTSEQLCQIASVYNLGYFLEGKTVITNRYIKKNIQYPGSVRLENQYFLLNKTHDSCFTPQIYTPNKTVYYRGDINKMTTLALLPDFPSQSLAIFSPESQNYRDKHQYNEIIYTVSVTDSIPNLTYGTSQTLFLGKDELITDVFYPFVRFPPDNFLYQFILQKEKREEDTFTGRKLLDTKILNASKRINEIAKWGVNNTWWDKTRSLYQQKMNDAIIIASRGKTSREDLDLVYEHLIKHEEKINELISLSSYWDNKKVNVWEETFTTLKRNTKESYRFPDFSTFSYQISPPVTGNYELLVGTPDDTFKDVVPVTFSMIESSVSASIEGSKRFKPIYSDEFLAKKQTVHISLINQLPNRIDPSEWQRKLPKTTLEEKELETHGDLLVYPLSDSQTIENWGYGNTYLLEINHQIDDEAVAVLVKENIEVYDSSRQIWKTKINPIVKSTLDSDYDDGKYRILIKASVNARRATVFLYGVNPREQIYDIDIHQVIDPQIHLRTKNSPKNIEDMDQPDITFTKVNPTRYIAHVSDAKKPYWLVFSESFSNSWHLSLPKESLFSDLTGNKNKLNVQHLMVNGYANAWYITPQSVKEKESYDLVIEYAPQRVFYLGIIISTISLVVCLFYSVYVLYRKKKYESN